VFGPDPTGHTGGGLSPSGGAGAAVPSACARYIGAPAGLAAFADSARPVAYPVLD